MSDQMSPPSDRGGGNLWTTMLNHPVGDSSEQTRNPQEQSLNRACEACRTSKVRCLSNPEPGSNQCQRCAKAGKTCVFAPPVKRRQRKRTDVRVAELEKEVKQMRDLLKHSDQSPTDGGDQEYAEDHTNEPEHSTEHTPSRSMVTPPPPTASHWPNLFQNDAPASYSPQREFNCKDSFGPSKNDIIDRGVITMQMAEELVHIWQNDLIEACPGISIPRNWTAAQLREKKPALFHAVMAAAAQSKGCALSDQLHDEAVYLYARSAFIQGEKSIQCIQAMMVTVAYYSPPKTPGHLQIYQWVNFAASCALELGLASRPRTHEQLPKRAIRSLQRISSPEELLEHCRTVLFLYIMSAGQSMRMKRPNILLFNSWMQECFVLLEKSKSIADQRTVAWLKLQRISDEAHTAFGFDDASTSFSLSELRMQVILRIFDRRMQEWKKSVSDEVMTCFLMIEHHAAVLLMWEFGMDGGRYDVTDFRNRHFTLPALDDDSVQPESLLSHSALQINATTKCISAAHAILDCVLEMPIDRLQKVPNSIFVRAIYALVVILKIEYGVGTDTEMSELIESEKLKADYYLDEIIRKITVAIGPQKCRSPSHWSFILQDKLISWHDEYKQWRQEGRHLKRRKTDPMDESSRTVPNQTPTFAEPTSRNNASSTHPLQPKAQPPAAQAPNFNMGSSYPTWTANSVPYGNAIEPQSGFTPDIGDFSAAFQNGDLYLWNDLSADNFGGWAPNMGFGQLNSQGF
ncbi:hypothetical protein P153DRAFT_399004 [Dothidotthia symphoricarpi CBS 119687]|uniref:Zn(2)-C6 fungal-type domain-containing protein n=1 Tax=Dothidotthia symphoricarpi CBS 119687 TaxID=1392245 RepID=A0A6A6A4U9_9PLEO|nr:uncharacterized protein P153DRAFT_399004 [Dothidotthia symphoricarpi CBS 119687]KAF2126919.1 hypothetical protein P153DRAFT_399004 [Dothidotthia symphoricarpi CBS 119687]